MSTKENEVKADWTTKLNNTKTEEKKDMKQKLEKTNILK